MFCLCLNDSPIGSATVHYLISVFYPSHLQADPPLIMTACKAGPPPSMDDSPFARRMDGLGHACSDRRLRTRQSIPCKLNTIPSMNPLNQPACRITQEGFTHRQAVSGYRWMDSGTVHDGLVGSGVQVGSIMRACKRSIHRGAKTAFTFLFTFIILSKVFYYLFNRGTVKDSRPSRTARVYFAGYTSSEVL